MVLSPDGKTLVNWGGSENTFRVWNVTTGKHNKTITEYTEYINNVLFSPDGQHTRNNVRV